MSLWRQFREYSSGDTVLLPRQRRLTSKVQELLNQRQGAVEERERVRKLKEAENAHISLLRSNDFVREIVSRQCLAAAEEMEERQEGDATQGSDSSSDSASSDDSECELLVAEEDAAAPQGEASATFESKKPKRKRSFSFVSSSPQTTTIPVTHYLWFDKTKNSFFCRHGKCGRAGHKQSVLYEGWPSVEVKAMKGSKGIKSYNLESHLNKMHKDLMENTPISEDDYAAAAAAAVRQAAEDVHARARAAFSSRSHCMDAFLGLSKGGQHSHAYLAMVQACFVAASRLSFGVGTSPWLFELVDGFGGNRQRVCTDPRRLSGPLFLLFISSALTRWRRP